MDWPWEEDEEKERLRQQVQKLEEEIESWKERYEAESERRQELSRKKQEAEEELNRLKDRLRTLEDDEDDEEDEDGTSPEELGFEEALQLVRKLGSIQSGERDMVTVYRGESVDEIGDLQGLKNSITGEQLAFLQESPGVYFFDSQLPDIRLKTRVFYSPEWSLDTGFDTSTIREFIEEQKIWVLVSAGDTKIYREEGGRVEELDHIKSRIEHKHSQGGYSQSRFERKREEQVENHLEEVRAALEDHEDPLLLGEERLCKELPGTHLGGFDPHRKAPEKLYSFQKAER
ncbi:MAG: Vms1/Ankzf1 family peptidyl-tRNA hydrolase [Candidatus Nanohaloarchaea archaeon]